MDDAPRSGDSVFTVQNLRHRHSAREILTDVSFTLHHGDRLGILGVNGAGKTTLMRLMAGVEKPDGGQLVRRRGLSVGYLPQEFALEDAQTVRQSIEAGAEATRAMLRDFEQLSARLASAQGHELEGLLTEQTALAERLELRDAWHLDRLVETVMQHLRVPAADRLIGTLSGGERRRVSLARTLVAQPDLLILDEPTNHLDASSIAWLEDYLASGERTCVLVTHDRYFLDRIVTRMLELERGQVRTYNGNYSDYLEAKAHEAEVSAQQEQVRQNTLRRELAWVRKQPKARQAKSKAREDAYYALADDTPPPALDEIALRIPLGPVRPGKKIVELAEVGKRQGDRWLFRQLNLSLQPGDRIGVVGANGLGKTTLMRVLQGLLPPDEGSVDHGPNTRFVYADQGRDQLDLSKTLLAEVAGEASHLQLEDRTITVRNYLRRFLFDDDQHQQPLAKFSGGEQNRAQLAKLLAVGGNTLILDEPTNDLDLPTLRALEEALLVFPGAALIVSHDRYFLNRVATRVLAFEGDGRVSLTEGSYDDYVARKGQDGPSTLAVAAQKPLQAAPVTPAAPSAGARKLTFKEKQELAGMEAAVEAAEGRKTQLDAELADPSLYVERGSEVPNLLAEAAAVQAEVERLYARWAELESRAEGEAR
ncbi:MAG: ATP-binding cassette domain-containing protein [Candidatus Sericytochromatia bacterium]|nr:ATP-binding cassette domain-containing protein [Candidatus Sericytochromatia bacterium]